jgi:hypothetical protein
MYPLSITLGENKPNEKMNRKYLFTFLIILSLSIVGYFIRYQAFNQTSTKSYSSLVTTKTTMPSPVQNLSVAGLSNMPAESGWKTYSNKKYGFEFQYPSTWTKEDKETEVINLSGTLTTVQINFFDAATKTTLLIEYHLAPKGAEIYKNALAQFNSSQAPYATGKSMVEVAGNKAIQATSVIRIDGRGNALNPPLQLVLVDFLDKAGTGEFQFQLKTSLPSSEAEVAKSKKLLSTFVFTN